MLGLQALHVKVSEPAVPLFRVAIGIKGNTRTWITRFLRGGSWGKLWLVGQEEEAVAGGL
jgi:hypothetical protein